MPFDIVPTNVRVFGIVEAESRSGAQFLKVGLGESLLRVRKAPNFGTIKNEWRRNAYSEETTSSRSANFFLRPSVHNNNRTSCGLT